MGTESEQTFLKMRHTNGHPTPQAVGEPESRAAGRPGGGQAQGWGSATAPARGRAGHPCSPAPGTALPPARGTSHLQAMAWPPGTQALREAFPGHPGAGAPAACQSLCP